jgi:DNA-binding Lrp family transcriptional regulator
MEVVLEHKSPKKVKLDKIDHRILHDLQEDGRITNVKLAENSGISAPPCLRRVRALEEDGYILGYHGELDRTRLDFKEMFFALVGLSSQAQTVLQGFEDQVSVWPEVRECHMIRGGGDFLLKIVARDKEQRDDLTMKLTSAENVIKVTTLETIRTSKSLSGVPIDISQASEGDG